MDDPVSQRCEDISYGSFTGARSGDGSVMKLVVFSRCILEVEDSGLRCSWVSRV